MNPLNFLLNGTLANIELLAIKLGAVLWCCQPDYARALFVSNNYSEIWKRNITELYQDIKLWKNYLADDNQEQIYQLIKARNSLINPKHTQIYSIILPDNKIQWILDRTFNLTDIDNQVLLIAGVALPIKENELHGAANKKVSDLSDKYILQYYQALYQNEQQLDKSSDFFKKINSLSKSEKNIFEMILYGLTAEQIANKLFVSRRTVEAHTNAIKEKLMCESKSEIISKAIELHLIHVNLPK